MRHDAIAARWFYAMGMIGFSMTAGAPGADLVLSVRDNTGSVLGGVELLDGDIVRYDQSTGTTSGVLAEDAFESGSIDVNAAHLMKDGTIVFSTVFNGAIGGVEFGDGDVVAYDAVKQIATILLPESAWSGPLTTTDVDAVFVHDDGRLVLSHVNEEDELGGLVFSDGDIVEYDVARDVARLLVAEVDLFDDGSGDVDGLHVLPDGRLLLSFEDDEVIGGESVRDGDVVVYDIARGAAQVFMSDRVFDSVDTANDIDAVSMSVGCGADVDGSGDVGFTDVLTILASWGACPAGKPCGEDLDGSGDVGFGDLLAVLACWGPCF